MDSAAQWWIVKTPKWIVMDSGGGGRGGESSGEEEEEGGRRRSSKDKSENHSQRFGNKWIVLHSGG